MSDCIKKNNFLYKLSKGTSSKTNLKKQKEFIEIYTQLKKLLYVNNELISFFYYVQFILACNLKYLMAG